MTRSISANVTLESSDGHKFTVERNIAMESGLIKMNIAKMGLGETRLISLPKVTRGTLNIIIDWCTIHVRKEKPISKSAYTKLTPWEVRYLKMHEESVVLDVIHAAHYMRVESLLGVCCQFVTMVDSTFTVTIDDISHGVASKPPKQQSSRHVETIDHSTSQVLLKRLLLEQARQDWFLTRRSQGLRKRSALLRPSNTVLTS